MKILLVVLNLIFQLSFASYAENEHVKEEFDIMLPCPAEKLDQCQDAHSRIIMSFASELSLGLSEGDAISLWVRLLCDNGAPEACYAIGLYLKNQEASSEYGDRALTERSESGAPAYQQWFRKSCELGSIYGCVGLGLSISGSDRDFKNASEQIQVETIYAYLSACEAAYRPACDFVVNSSFYVAESENLPDGSIAFANRMVSILSTYCEAGHLEKCEEEAVYCILAADNKPENAKFGEGLELLRETCDNGLASACSLRAEIVEYYSE